MDYEKEYKSLVAKVKKAHLFAQTDSTKAVLEDILPELAESEDERIRKAIWLTLIATEDEQKDFYSTHGLTRKDCTDWLEKQKDAFENGRQFGIMQEQARIELDFPEKQKEQKPEGVYVDCAEHPEWYGMPPKEPKPAWNEKDKDILESLIRLYSMNYSGERWDWTIRDKYTYGDVVNFLKSLRPQPRQVWSEEDDNALKYLHELISWGYAEKFMDSQTTHDMRKWVNEHLHPDIFQNGNSHWKPSEEQMKALEHAKDACEEEWGYEDTALRSLINDLKKL